MSIDLHSHTNISDGDYSPSHLLEIAKERGIGTLAITDHDSVDGYDEDLFRQAEDLGIELIPGIELSTVDTESQQKIHVLGLFIDPYDQKLRELCSNLRQQRVELMQQVAVKLCKHGFELRVDDLISSGKIITKAHIGRDVIENPTNEQALLDAHGQIPTQGKFIESWLVKDRPAFVQASKPLSTNEAIQVIQEANGIASCAHPSFNVLKGFALESMKQLILRNRFDAVEAINIQYDKDGDDKQFDLVQEFSEFAHDNGLLITGGSDFHSDNHKLWGNHSELGLVNEAVSVNSETLENLKSTLK